MEAQFTSGTRASPLQSFMYESSYSTYGSPVPTAQRSRKRHDSMMRNPQVALRPAEPISRAEQPPHARERQTTPKEQHQAPRPDQPLPVPVPKQAAFRFCVTTNPQVKDKDEMRENRKHVMHDFLRKEGRKTSGPRDARAAGPLQPNQPEKRRRLESSTTEALKSLNPAAPMRMFGPGVLTPQSSCEAMGSGRHGDSEGEESTMAIAAVPASHVVQDMTSYCGLATNPQPYVEEDEQDLEERQEAEHASSETGDLFSLLGFRVGPYHSFFQATRPNVDLEKLKYDCGRRLRSDSMVTTWLPTLVRAKHCFLSTICISAAHEEAIREVAFETQNVRALQRNSAYERLAVKSQVHGMINAILDDPEQRTSDETIVAVMNMLNSEMIGCDLEALRVHQTGINSMVLMRGGLDGLGVHGHLARTLTITMLVNSVLQERVADDMYLHYAQRQAAPSTTNGTTSRASMFYCGVLEWADLNRFLSPRSETMALLNLVRKLTGVFRGNADSRKANLQRLRDQIWEFKEKTSVALPTQGDRVYEAVRLTARVYADALAKRTPFSKACRTAESTESGTSDTRPAAFVQIAQSLSHTNLQDYWGGLSGVLFWVALVTGAAAKRAFNDDPKQSTTSARKQQEDAASRLLAAVAVRGSIVFGFEQGPAVLGTLSNMLDLQDRLSGWSGRAKGRAVFGPERLIGRQSGFSDFAEEFRSVEE